MILTSFWEWIYLTGSFVKHLGPAEMKPLILQA